MQRIEELYHRYRIKIISDDEKQELFELMRDADDDRLAALADSYLCEQEPKDLTYLQPDTDRILIGIKDHIARQEAPSAKKLPLKRIITIAATALMIGFAAYYIYKNHNPTTEQPTLTSIYGDDVAPGSNRATLTFDNGQSITLREDKEGIHINADSITYADGTTLTESGHVQYATLAVPRAGQYQITLSDGTKVWLNAQTILKYPVYFKGAERKVEVQGEAYFEVTHDPQHPFIVSSGGQTVKVLGTSFNINTYNDNATTTLVSGSIQLSDQMQHTQILSPGQQATETTDGFRIKAVDTENYTAWKEGVIILSNQTIHDILHQLERWYDVEFVNDQQIDPSMALSGDIPRDINLSGLLQALEQQTQVKFKIEGRRIMIGK